MLAVCCGTVFGFMLVLVGKCVKRLKGDSELHYSHQDQIKYGKLSFHGCKSKHKYIAMPKFNYFFKLNLE